MVKAKFICKTEEGGCGELKGARSSSKKQSGKLICLKCFQNIKLSPELISNGS